MGWPRRSSWGHAQILRAARNRPDDRTGLDPEEAWRIMESYFNRETRMLDRSIEEILSYGRMVNDEVDELGKVK